MPIAPVLSPTRSFFRLRSQFDTKKNDENGQVSHPPSAVREPKKVFSAPLVSAQPPAGLYAFPAGGIAEEPRGFSKAPTCPQTCFMPGGNLRMIGCFERWFKASNPI